MVRAVSLSHQVAGSKQPLRRFCGGKACLGFSLPQTPLMWEPPALGLPPFSAYSFHHALTFCSKLINRIGEGCGVMVLEVSGLDVV